MPHKIFIKRKTIYPKIKEKRKKKAYGNVDVLTKLSIYVARYILTQTNLTLSVMVEQ